MASKPATNQPGTGLLGTGTHLFGSNPIIDNPLNPVYDTEQAIHSASYTGKQVNKTANQVSNTVNTITKGASAVGNITKFVTNGQNWIRLLEVIAGVVLIVMGLHQLAGGGSVVPAPVKTAVKVAAVA